MTNLRPETGEFEVGGCKTFVREDRVSLQEGDWLVDRAALCAVVGGGATKSFGKDSLSLNATKLDDGLESTTVACGWSEAGVSRRMRGGSWRVQYLGSVR